MSPTDQPFRLSDKKLVLLFNRKSGKRSGPELLTMLRDQLSPVVAEFDLRPLSKGQDIVDMAAGAVREGADIVAALGGDGTQAAVAQALVGTSAVMGVLPGGTFNYFARELGVGETVPDAVETLLNPRLRQVSIGDLNGRIFLNNVSFGAYPEILEKRESHYARWGRSRIGAYWAVLAALRDLRHPMELTLQVNGEKRDYRTALTFAAKSAFQLETLGLEGAEAVRRDHLAIFIARAHRARDLIGPALRLALGLSTRDKDFDLVVSDDVQIRTHPNRRLVAHDGERTRMTGPFRLRVQPGALNVLVPAGPAVPEDAA